MSDQKSSSKVPDNYGTYDRFIAFRAAIMQAIALAWQDPGFLEFLRKDPKAALKERIGYDFPFNMNLSLNEGIANWDTLIGDWHVTRQNKLVLPLPPAPPAGEQLEALAAFNAHHLTFLN